MFGVIRGFKTYLEKQLRLPESEVVEYLGYVPIFVDHLEVTDVRQITGNRVQNAWKNRRWELTEDGIKVNEVAENGYEGFLVGGRALQDGRERELADG